MKEPIELDFQPRCSARPASQREWNSRSVFRLALAVAVLVAVYLLATRIPIAPPEASLDLLAGFIVYWGMGGLATVILLIISDRVTRRS